MNTGSYLLPLLLMASINQSSAEPNASVTNIVVKRCAACHGIEGNHPLILDYPRLAGQHKQYLQTALKAQQSLS